MTLKSFIFFALIISSSRSLQNKYCYLSCDYVVTNFSHTVCDREQEKCGPHEQCGLDFNIIELTNEQRQYILDMHNDMRNRVSTGNESRGDQPSAANMNILIYNRELEFIAQCWANTCNGNPLIHDHCRRTGEFEHVGQNLGFINSSLTIDVEKSITELITLWYNEVDLFENSWVNETKDRGPEFKVGHYTQMMWADTSHLGCAISSYTTYSYNRTWNHIVLVCNYGPGGNYIGLPVYEVGEPASNCIEGLEPNQEFSGLCGRSEPVGEDNDSFYIFQLD